MTAILYAPFEKCADTSRPREQELEEQKELLQNDGVRAKGLTPSAIDHVCPLSCQKVCCDRRWSGAGGAFKSFYHLNGIWQKAGFIFIVSSPLFPLPPAVTFPFALVATRTAQNKSHEICKCPLWSGLSSRRAFVFAVDLLICLE